MKNRKGLFTSVIIAVYIFITANTFAQDWKWGFNGSGINHRTEFLTTDINNNMYFAVYYNDSLKVNGQTYYHYQWPDSYNCLLLKLDKHGNLLSQMDLYSPPGFMNTLQPIRMAADQLGNVFVAGTFAVRLFIGDTVINHLLVPDYEGTEAYLAKFDCNFDIKWAKVIGCENYLYLRNMTIRNNRIYYTVNPNSWSSFEPVTLYCFGQDTLQFPNNSEYTVNFYLDFDGQILSHTLIHGQGAWIEKEIIIENNDRYLIGGTSDTIFFENKPIFIPDPANYWEEYVLHFDSQDSLVGTSSIKTNPQVYVNIVGATTSDELYFTVTGAQGLSIGNVTFPYLYANTCIIGKLNTQRQVSWYKSFVGVANPAGIYTAQRRDTLFMAFDFSSLIIIDDTTLYSPGGWNENYILGYTADGNMIRNLKTNTTGYSQTTGFAFDNCENILLCGTFQGTAFYGEDTLISQNSSGAGSDFFIGYLEYSKKQFNLLQDTVICGQYLIEGPAGWEHYSWNNGVGNQKDFVVTESGKCTLKAWTGTCCSMEDSVDITIVPLPEISLGNDTILKQSHSLQLSAPAGYEEYTWSTGASNSGIVLEGSQMVVGFNPIWCQVRNNNCTSTDTIMIEVINDIGIFEQPPIEILTRPNPFSDKLIITCDKPVQEIRIFDYSGKILFTSQTSQDYIQPMEITFPAEVNRFLVLQIKAENEFYYRKIVQLKISDW